MQQTCSSISVMSRELLTQDVPHPEGCHWQRIQELPFSLQRLIIGDTLLYLCQQIYLDTGQNVTILGFYHDEAHIQKIQYSDLLSRQGDSNIWIRFVRSVSPCEFPSLGSRMSHLLHRSGYLYADRFGTRQKIQPAQLGSVCAISLWKVEYLQSFFSLAKIVQKHSEIIYLIKLLEHLEKCHQLLVPSTVDNFNKGFFMDGEWELSRTPC